MFKLLLVLAVLGITTAQFYRSRAFRSTPKHRHRHQFQPFSRPFIQFDIRPMQLCTFSDIEFDKCTHTVDVAFNNSIPLQLECVRQNKWENCLNSVEMGSSDMVVLPGHGYIEARHHGLIPLIFAKEDDSSLYVAVAPRNITLKELQEAPISFDQSNHRAFHAAAFFQHQMGYDICAYRNKAALGQPYISIVDSADYVPNSEEILICPNRLPGEFKDYKQCNIEAGLQRAVFVSSYMTSEQEEQIWEIFQTIYQHFGPHSKSQESENFNFFDTFKGKDNVLFKNNTISFDLQPTYRNGIDENLFEYLHCNADDEPHDPRLFS